jgi:lysophospholipase L1-like esterase
MRLLHRCCLLCLLLTAACALPPTTVDRSAPSPRARSEAVPAGGGTAPPPTPPLTATPAPLQLISRGLPAAASSARSRAAFANDADYNTVWRSEGVPAWLAYDLGGVPEERRARVLLVWYNGTYGYTHTMGCRGVGYNNLGAYLVEAHAERRPGEAGWVQLAEVRDNSFHSRQHLLELAGYRWLRLRALASDGSPQNDDVALNMDLYHAGPGLNDGWIFFGDSITAGAMGHDAIGPEPPATSFAQQVAALTGGRAFPPQENAGIPCIKTSDLVPHFAEWLARFPGRYVVISLGTNDAGALAAEEFYANYAAMVEATLAAGKRPVVPTIPWSPDPERQADTLELNAAIAELYDAYPALLRGPNLWTFFAERPELLSDDGIHPSEAGYAAYRSVWARFAAETIYGAGGEPPAP